MPKQDGLPDLPENLAVLAGVQPASSESFAKLAASVASHAAAVSSAIACAPDLNVRRERLVALLKGLRVAVRPYVVTGDVEAVEQCRIIPAHACGVWLWYTSGISSFEGQERHRRGV